MNIRNLFLSLLVLVTAAVAVEADPLTFNNVAALQNGGNTHIDLFSNPGVTLYGSQLNFSIDVSGTLNSGQTDTLLISYMDSLGGSVLQHFDFPLFGTLTNVNLFVTVNLPNINFAGIPATLSVDLVQSNPDFILPSTGAGVNSYTYSFVVAEPVPEPTSLLLLGTAVGSLMTALRAKSSKEK